MENYGNCFVNERSELKFFSQYEAVKKIALLPKRIYQNNKPIKN